MPRVEDENDGENVSAQANVEPRQAPSETITFTLSDLSVKKAEGVGIPPELKLDGVGSRSGARPALGATVSEDSLSAATTRSETALSFRVSKRSRTDRVGVTLESTVRRGVTEGVMITNLKEGGSIAQAGASMGDKLVSINGVHVTSARVASELFKNALGDVEVVVERTPTLLA